VSAFSPVSSSRPYQNNELVPTAKLTQPELGKKKYRWNQQNYSSLGRRIDIWKFVLSLIFRLWRNNRAWSYVGGYTPEKRTSRQQIQAAWIRESLLELGPTFIKVGQLFSTRADLFPTEYVEELSKLQDRVPAFTYEQAIATIETDLGKPLNQLFRNFDPTPIAAASLGQVHKAQLHNGEEVVVKIQRPGLKKLFQIDLAILKQITRYFHSHPRWGKNRDWLGIYEECSRILWQEADYLNEGRNADTFRRNFRDQDWVKVPKIYWRYTSPKVLTLEYLPGIKISHYEALDAAGIDRTKVAKLSAQAYLQQLLGNGFFHADPHPGNLAVSANGGLIFYDFGMMGQIKANVKVGLMETLFGITQKDADRVVRSLIDLGALAPTGEVAPVRRSIQYMLDNFMDKEFTEQSVNAISDDLYEIAYDQPFRFPATFTFVLRAFSTLEGVGKGLDPNFNFMAIAQPYALDLIDKNTATATIFDEISRQAAEISNTTIGLPQRIDATLDRLEQGDVKLRVKASESDRLLRRLSLGQKATQQSIFISALLLCSTLLFVNAYIKPAIGLGLLSAFPGISLVQLWQKIDRLDRKIK
jgi:predicted unusual protein kinase regulating ubiquinone biosynthesis (AarF/ABC1/UbiB family)